MRPTTRNDQRRHLEAICAEVVRGTYQRTRLAELLDMHLQRRGLCIVTTEERNHIQYQQEEP